MIDPSDKVNPHLSSTTPQPASSPETSSPHSDYKLSKSADAFIKQLVPNSTQEERAQIFDLMMRSIADRIQSDQKFHEEQRERRKEESGDEGEI